MDCRLTFQSFFSQAECFSTADVISSSTGNPVSIMQSSYLICTPFPWSAHTILPGPKSKAEQCLCHLSNFVSCLCPSQKAAVLVVVPRRKQSFLNSDCFPEIAQYHHNTRLQCESQMAMTKYFSRAACTERLYTPLEAKKSSVPGFLLGRQPAPKS